MIAAAIFTESWKGRFQWKHNIQARVLLFQEAFLKRRTQVFVQLDSKFMNSEGRSYKYLGSTTALCQGTSR